MSTGSSLTAGPIDRRRNNFDALRLLAAWLVLYSHCYPLSGQPISDPFARTVGIDTLGGIGVGIFFVISGYLVTQSRERASSIADFIGRRSIRIFPAMIVLTILAVLVLGPVFTKLSLREYFSNSQTWSYLRNSVPWTIQYALPGTFADNPAAHVVNGSLWSMPYELRCYIALMLLWLLPLRRSLLLAASATVLAVFLVERPPTPPAGPFDKHWGLDYYAVKLGLYFAIGATVALIPLRPVLLLLSGTVATVATILLPLGNMQTVCYVVALSTLTLWCGLAVPLPKLPEKMGDWSYGLYVYGFPVQQMVATMPEARANLPLFVVVTTLLAFVCAALSWFLVEKPALNWYRARTARGGLPKHGAA